jgi:hypothetical protein
MSYLLIKAAISGILIAVISEIARRSPGFGALIASLPLVSIMGAMWLWRDRPDPANMAHHLQATFWYVLPSLPMFLLVPMLLTRGWNFWTALIAGCVLTVVLYFAMLAIGPKLGLRL